MAKVLSMQGSNNCGTGESTCIDVVANCASNRLTSKDSDLKRSSG